MDASGNMEPGEPRVEVFFRCPLALRTRMKAVVHEDMKAGGAGSMAAFIRATLFVEIEMQEKVYGIEPEEVV